MELKIASVLSKLQRNEINANFEFFSIIEHNFFIIPTFLKKIIANLCQYVCVRALKNYISFVFGYDTISRSAVLKKERRIVRFLKLMVRLRSVRAYLSAPTYLGLFIVLLINKQARAYGRKQEQGIRAAYVYSSRPG